MAVTPEQVRKLSEASGVDEIAALSALERRGGNLLEAMLELERQGSVRPPDRGGFYSTRGAGPSAAAGAASGGDAAGRRGAQRSWWRVEAVDAGTLVAGLKDLFHRSMVNHLEVRRHSRVVTRVPLLILLLLLVCFPWILLPVLGVGLVVGFRYRLTGPDMDRENLDRSAKKAASAVAEAADKLKAEWKKRR